jgi:signal transduction histidine kinase
MVTALTLFSLLLYTVLQLAYMQAVDQSLIQVAGEVQDYWQNYRTLPDPSDVRFYKSTYVMIRDPQGGVWSNLDKGYFPMPEAAKRGEQVFLSDTDARGVPYRLCTVPITARGEIIAWVQVAYDLDILHTASNQLKMPLVMGALLFLGLSAWGTWWVAWKAISPVDNVARAAEAIGDSANLSLRVPYQGPDDEVGRLVKTFNDMLDQLQAMYERLSTSIDAQQRFVADASHELRTPLTIIRGNIDYLQKAGKLDPEALADMASEAERMTHLIEELLTVARADAGQTLELHPVPLGPLVEEACRKAQALPHTVDFQAELPDALDRVTVLGHSEWLVRAMIILVENAFKYTPQGSVTVRAGRQAEGVVVQVQDTGIGIAREDLPNIFERFFRADRARTRGGSGLGLAIARWVVGVHGGKLTVDSELGKGSTFSLWLPLHRE